MIIRIIFIFILSIKLFQSIKVTDFCYQISIDKEVIKCKENNEYNYQCFEGLCTVDRYSCQSFKLFSTVKDIQRTEKSRDFFKNQYQLFLGKIKDCPEPPKYEWTTNDVCFNTKDCLQTKFWRIWSTFLKLGECKCTGGYNHKCNSDYCASDKRGCDHLKQTERFKIKNC
jgi:hypothetical protein